MKGGVNGVISLPPSWWFSLGVQWMIAGVDGLLPWCRPLHPQPRHCFLPFAASTATSPLPRVGGSTEDFLYFGREETPIMTDAALHRLS